VLFTLALLTFCEGFTNIGIVDFRREFAFDKEFRLQIIPRLVGIVVAVGSAWIWQSYWALIAGLVTGRLLRVVASYVMHPYRPRLGLRAWRSLLGYSSWTWVITMVALLRDRVDSFVIGRTLNETYVGVYSIGSEVALLPSTELVFPLCRVAFSGFAEARRTEASVGQIYLRLVGAVSLLTIPAAIGVALVAEPLVRLAFGERWLAAIPVVRVLGLAGAFAAPGLMAETLLGVYGQLYRTFGARVVGLAIRLGLLLALTPLLGLLGAAIAAAIGMAVESVVLTLTALRHAGQHVRDLLICIWRPVLASAAMAAVLLASRLLTGTPSAHPGLVLPSALGALVYGAVLLGLWKACGHLDGAERDMLTLLARAAVRLRAVARPFRRWRSSLRKPL
jgi:O-antigen/teichoic acid export membrane protein